MITVRITISRLAFPYGDDRARRFLVAVDDAVRQIYCDTAVTSAFGDRTNVAVDGEIGYGAGVLASEVMCIVDYIRTNQSLWW